MWPSISLSIGAGSARTLTILYYTGHREQRKDRPHQSVTSTPNELEVSANTAAAKLKPYPLLMTCQVLIMAPNGLSVRVKACSQYDGRVTLRTAVYC